MIHLKCACGAFLEVLEVYAGGHVVCHTCGSSVTVPTQGAAEERFRFHCPHCETRVVARRTSAGKKSQCPSCGKIYVVPDPPPEFAPEPPPSKDETGRRYELATDDLALQYGLPFPVGKLEPITPAPPQPRYVHSPDQVEEARQAEPDTPIPPHVLPEVYPTGPASGWPPSPPYPAPGFDPRWPGYPPLAPPAPPLPPIPGPGHFPNQRETYEFPRIIGASADASSSIPTAAAIPQMPFPFEPEGFSGADAHDSRVRDPTARVSGGRVPSVGELQITSGNCQGQRIRLEFRNFVIGLERDCDLRPSSPLLSRHHCVFKKDEYALRVRDLGSTNGTYVNGRRIFGEAILKPGDDVTVGDITLHVLLPHSPQVVHSTADSEPSISDFVIL